MNVKKHQNYSYSPPQKHLSLSLAIALIISYANNSFAIDFNLGDVKASLTSNLSVGVSVPTTKANTNLIGANNGGASLTNATDDGRLNFERGKPFSQIFKGSHDLQLDYSDFGFLCVVITGMTPKLKTINAHLNQLKITAD